MTRPIDLLLSKVKFTCTVCGTPAGGASCRCFIKSACQCGYKGAIVRSEWMLPDAVARIELLSCPQCADDSDEVWRDKDGNIVAQFDSDDTYLGGRRGKPLPRKATP